MTFYVGVDLGTTFSAAAVWRDGRVEMANLGTHGPVIPSVVFLRDDGAVLVGEGASRRSVTEPRQVAREFKRRFGDPTPVMLGGTPYSADALTAKLLRWVVEAVAQREGGTPAGVVLTHPASWGPFKLDLLRQAVRLAGLDGVGLVTEPEAAAIHYASQTRVERGEVVAVYDLGGGTFDAAVLRKTDVGWGILGEPEGAERLGGIDFDQAVLDHVLQTIGQDVSELDPGDATAATAVARLRQECVAAKEALAADVDVTIPVTLPTIQTEVRLTRAEFETMIRPTLADSITALGRALRSAQVGPADVAAVLLVGGSSRLPLVAELVSAHLQRPVAVDEHPKHAVALGAAIVAAQRGAGEPSPTKVVATTEAAMPTHATSSGPGTKRRRGLVVAAVAGVVAAAAVVAAFALRESDDGDDRSSTRPPTTEAATGSSSNDDSNSADSGGTPQDAQLDIEQRNPAGASIRVTRLAFDGNDILVDVEVYNGSQGVIHLNDSVFGVRLKLVDDAERVYNFVEPEGDPSVPIEEGEILTGTLAFRGPLHGQPAQLRLVVNVELDDLDTFNIDEEPNNPVAVVEKSAPDFVVPMDLTWE